MRLRSRQVSMTLVARATVEGGEERPKSPGAACGRQVDPSNGVQFPSSATVLRLGSTWTLSSTERKGDEACQQRAVLKKHWLTAPIRKGDRCLQLCLFLRLDTYQG